VKVEVSIKRKRKDMARWMVTEEARQRMALTAKYAEFHGLVKHSRALYARLTKGKFVEHGDGKQ
jgi:hypothetical protein